MILARIKNLFSSLSFLSLGNRQRTLLRNGFFVCLGLWILVTASLGYQYVIYASQTTDTKGGTLVEGVPRSISFLPYLSNEDTDVFYQSLLFHSCIVTKPGTQNVEFKESLCKITTTDNISYTVSVNPNFQWRDGVPVSAQDVFFTYNEIIRNNTRQIPYLESYEKIIVTQTPDQKVRVTFPAASVDNTLFFTKFILPAHILEYKTQTYYKDLFSRNVVGSACGRIQRQQTDQSSLIFDLSRCGEFPISFYQIKSFSSQDELVEYSENSNNSIIDFTVSDLLQPGYDTKVLPTRDYVALFFNTKSPLLDLDARKAFSAFILSGFFQSGFQQLIQKDQYLFPFVPPSDTMTQLKSLNQGVRMGGSTDQGVTLDDLKAINVQSLPTELTIQGRNKKAVYTLQNLTKILNLRLRFASEYDKVTITANDGKEFAPPSFDKKTKMAFYNISLAEQNIKEGLNKYVIKGYRNNAPRVLLTLDVYYFDEEPTSNTGSISSGSQQGSGQQQKIKIIYYQDDISESVAQRIQLLLKQEKLDGAFQFIGYANSNEFEGKLISKNYDVVIRSIQMGWRRDLSNIFLTDQPYINPSGYKNPNLSTFMSQYLTEKGALKDESNVQMQKIFQSTFPVLFLGKEYEFAYFKKELQRATGANITRDQLQDHVVRTVKLAAAKRIKIDRNRLLNLQTLREFINEYF